jgi:hypothetical protein
MLRFHEGRMATTVKNTVSLPAKQAHDAEGTGGLRRL